MRRRSVSSLRFARTAGADAAAQARHRRAVAGQPRQQVVQLRQLHLQLAFARAGAAGEDIEDQLRAVEDLDIERLLQIALLGGRQFAVEDDRRWLRETRPASSVPRLCRSRSAWRRRRGAATESDARQPRRRRLRRAPPVLRGILRRRCELRAFDLRGSLRPRRSDPDPTRSAISSPLAMSVRSDVGVPVPERQARRARPTAALECAAAVERPRNHHGGDRVLENQLLLIVGFEDHGVLVETLDSAGKLHSAHQVDGEETSCLCARCLEMLLVCFALVFPWELPFRHRPNEALRSAPPAKRKIRHSTANRERVILSRLGIATPSPIWTNSSRGGEQQSVRQLAAVDQTLDHRHRAPHPLAMQQQTAGHQQRDAESPCSSARTCRSRRRGPAHAAGAARCISSELKISCKRLLAQIADRSAIQHVALAARIHAAVVLHVHRAAPQIVARPRRLRRSRCAFRLHQVGLVFLDAHLVDARHRAPESRKSSTSCALPGMRTICTTICSFDPRSCFIRAKRTKLSRTFSNFAPLR